ncbi:MAG: hypothetical protein KatS3mg014_0940 [Actinomycetota bacterium]|nr:MAG: hypothetical protein KatS3mg014_0940 [Actinomycetota bacterium]
MSDDRPAPDAAYEDHWYRSMKALADHPAEDEGQAPLPEVAVREADILARAEQLLRRLRSMPTPER